MHNCSEKMIQENRHGASGLTVSSADETLSKQLFKMLMMQDQDEMTGGGREGSGSPSFGKN